MKADHEKELKLFKKVPNGKLVYAMAILSDVVDGRMMGDELQEHVNDVKELICKSIEESVGTWKKVGVVGVDSGRLLITDYPEHATVQGDALVDRLFKEDFPLVCQVPFDMGHMGAAVSIAAGIGDGTYDVEALIGNVPPWGERVKEVRIRFVPHPVLGDGIELLEQDRRMYEK